MRRKLSGLLLGTAALVGVTAFVVLMGSLVYPGALEWTASVVCDEDKPDTMVVRDTYSTEPGETTTNFTLYCIGPRGAYQDAGFGKPVGVLVLYGAAAAVGLALLLWLVRAVRRLASGGGPDDDEPDYGGGPSETGPVSPSPEMQDFGGQPPLIT